MFLQLSGPGPDLPQSFSLWNSVSSLFTSAVNAEQEASTIINCVLKRLLNFVKGMRRWWMSQSSSLLFDDGDANVSCWGYARLFCQ